MPSIENMAYIGRQGIYDQNRNIFGYELLYRNSDKGFADFSDGDKASSNVLLNAFVEFGIEQIIGPNKAFINFTRKFFIDVPPLPFDPNQVILELLEDIDVDQPLIDGVINLHKLGYKFAIDDFIFEEKWKPLLPYASIIKIEIPQFDWDNAEKLLHELRKHDVKLLAEKVETAEEHEKLKTLNFDYFQGYYYSHPKILKAKTIPENEIVILRLLSRLNDPGVTIEELNELIEQDLGLSFKILKYINSASVGLSRNVESIKQAVVYLGLNRIKSWTSLLAITGMKGGNKESMTNAMVRGYMCQAMINKCGKSNPDTAFTVGTLSILDEIMQTPIDEILEKLPLSIEVANALSKHEGILGQALTCTLAYEKLEWDKADFPDCDPDQLNKFFIHSTSEAFKAITDIEN